MPTRTSSHQREFTRFKPRENQLYTREGFDRKQVRYEFANSNDLGLSDLYIEQDDQLRIDHQTVDLSDGPTGIGEGGGAGVSFVVEDGDRFPTNRYDRSFTLNLEEIRAGANSANRQRDAVLEMFDFEHDVRFLTGHYNHVDDWVPGIFQYLDNNIPSDRVLDASTYSYSGTEENIIKYDAFSQISNRLMDVNNPVWGAMVGSQDALTHFNKVSEGSSDRSSYWDRLNSNDNAGVGIADMMWMPKELQFDLAVDEQDPLTFSLVDGNSQWDGLGSDEVYLLPPMDEVRSKFWQLYEMAEPELDGPHATEGGRRRFEYIDRFAVDYDPTDKHGSATDAVKITNVSQLFA